MLQWLISDGYIHKSEAVQIYHRVLPAEDDVRGADLQYHLVEEVDELELFQEFSKQCRVRYFSRLRSGGAPHEHPSQEKLQQKPLLPFLSLLVKPATHPIVSWLAACH